MVALDLSEASNGVIRKVLHETIENQLKTKNYKFNVTSASKDGDSNFVGIIYRVTFNEMNGNGCENSETSKLILKVAPQNKIRRNQFLSRECFVREIYMYNEVNRYISNSFA